MITGEFETYFSKIFEKILLNREGLWNSVKSAASLSVQAYCNKENILCLDLFISGFVAESETKNLENTLTSLGYKCLAESSHEDHGNSCDEIDSIISFHSEANSFKKHFIKKSRTNPVYVELAISSDSGQMEGNADVALNFVGEKETVQQDLKTISEKNIISIVPVGRIPYIFMLGTSAGGLNFTRIKGNAIPLESENYSTNINSEFEYISKELIAPAPAGRLVIMTGLPGTGKTFLIRALINELYRKASFIYIPSNMAESIDSPKLISLILSHKAAEQNRPLILILEDADTCIEERTVGNMSIMSSLLNYTDGIMGSILDLRVISTTNLNNLKLDSAITRPGRLLAKIDFEKLSPKELKKFYITKGKKDIAKTIDNQELTLAEAYSLINNQKLSLFKKDTRKKIGFSSK